MDLYKILDLNNDCSLEDIKNSYKKLALKWHPDRNLNNLEEANIKFKNITNAYSILTDIEKKKQYDLSGKLEDFSGNPLELFNFIFKDVNHKIIDLIQNTYNNINKDGKKKGIVNIIKNIDKDTKINILNESIDLLNEFLKRQK